MDKMDKKTVGMAGAAAVVGTFGALYGFPWGTAVLATLAASALAQQIAVCDPREL